MCLKSLACFSLQCFFMFSLFNKACVYILYKNAFLYIISSEKAKTIVKNCYIIKKVSETVLTKETKFAKKVLAVFLFLIYTCNKI